MTVKAGQKPHEEPLVGRGGLWYNIVRIMIIEKVKSNKMRFVLKTLSRPYKNMNASS